MRELLNKERVFSESIKSLFFIDIMDCDDSLWVFYATLVASF